MKKITLVILSLLVGFSTLTWAQKVPEVNNGIRPYSGKMLNARPKAETKAEWPMPTSPVYGMLAADVSYKAKGFAVFDKYTPTQLKLIAPFYSSEILTGRAGAYAEGEYYAYLYWQYTYESYPESFSKIDLKTGETIKIASITQWEEDKNETVISMTYDNTNKVMYALVEDRDNSSYACTLATVNLKTGEYTPIKALKRQYLAIAADYSGKLYAIGRNEDNTGSALNQLIVTSTGDVEEQKVVEPTLNGNPFLVNYAQAMTFDHTNWKLYWAAQDDAIYPNWVELDLKTGEMTTHGTIGWNATILGLYIPYQTADSPEAAGSVNDLQCATVTENGENKVKVSWMNPTTSWNKEALTELKSVDLYRDDELIYTDSNPKMGELSSYLDSKAANGYNTYKVIAHRVANENGLPTSIQYWFGFDNPNVVTDLNVVPSADNLSATISWTAPVDGAHGGVIDASTLKYDITRLPDSVAVATDCASTSFVDNTISQLNTYSYSVVAKNAQGESEPVVSQMLPLGPNLEVPYSVLFDDACKANLWTVVDVDNNGYTWYYSDMLKAFASDPEGGANDWVISPNINLKKGKSYRVTMRACAHYKTEYTKESLKIGWGQGKTAEAMTNILQDVPEIPDTENHDYSNIVTPTEDGTYNFGMYCYSESGSWGVWFGYFEIKEIQDNDLQATSIKGEKEIQANRVSKYEVGVYNNGSKPASNYKVQLVDEDNNVLAENSDVVTYESGEAGTTVVEFTPTADMVGKTYKVFGKAVLENDADHSNDVTEASVSTKILPYSDEIWYANKPTGENPELEWSSNIPLSYASKASVSETIYTPAMMEDELDGEYKISKISFRYSFNDDLKTAFRVYLGTTSMTEFNDDASNWITPADLTLVYDCTTDGLDVTKGEDDLVITFTDPVMWDTSKNLVVLVEKPMGDLTDDYGKKFYVYSDNDATTHPTVKYLSDRFPFDWTSNSFRRSEATIMVPAIRLSMSPIQSGVSKVDNDNFSYYQNGEKLIVNATNCADVALYDMQGHLCGKAAFNNNHAEISLNSLKGIYLMRTAKKTVKIVIK